MTLKEKLLAQARASKKADSAPLETAVLAPDPAPPLDASPIPDLVGDPSAYIPDPSVPDPSRPAPSKVEDMRHVTTKTHIKHGVAFPVGLRKALPPDLVPYEPDRGRRSGHFLKGSSGNPAGGAPSLVEYIKLMTGDGQEIVDHMTRTMRGSMKVKVRPKGHICKKCLEKEAPTVEYEDVMMPAEGRYQVQAAAWLAERGWGKSPLIIQTEAPPEDEYDYDLLTVQEADELRRLQDKARKHRALPSGTVQGEVLSAVVSAHQADAVQMEDDEEDATVTPALPHTDITPHG